MMVYERLVSCGGQTPGSSLPIVTTAATHGYSPPLRSPPPLAPAPPHPFPTTTTTTKFPSLPKRPARHTSLSLSRPTSPGCCAMTSASSRPARRDAAEKGDRSEYEEALRCLSSLITGKKRADGKNRGDQFDLMFQYLKILELEDAVEELKVIHVAGTKGKGSTCSFTESILRNCGFRTGLFTSPHLIDIRERFRLDGMEISEEKFLHYFWWCWDKLHGKIDDTIPMPTYFRFLALLAFRIFSAEQVDVAIMEVGLGGKFDATNVVKAPIVCGISSLGHDHMEILGNTLGQIAGEKAGIFKENVPAYTVPQPEEAMRVLEDRAFQLGISLSVIQPLGVETLNGQYLGLDGEHQYLNAGLATALCRAWLKETGHDNSLNLYDAFHLSEKFIRGLTTTSMLGRAQILPDPQFGRQCNTNLNFGGLTFYLDGAHSPESMEICARWFSNVTKEDIIQERYDDEHAHDYQNPRQILLFNCMSVRDPQVLLPRLVNVCADHGIYFHRALFVPSLSVYNKVGSNASTSTDTCQADLSWQQTLQRVWENLVHGDKYSKMHGHCNGTAISIHEVRKDAKLSNLSHQENSSLCSSLPLAIKLIRDTAKENQSIHFRVLVTGSLHLVGDVLKLIKK